MPTSSTTFVRTQVTVALYVRVSTEEQAKEGFSVPAQKDRLLSFCKSQGWNVADIYVDEGFSGAKLGRPALTRLRDDARAKKFDLVLVWKVDRLSRKVAHLAALVEEFDREGIAFRSMTEPFDTTHAAGRAFMQMLGVFAELERENIRERSKMGILRRAQEGFMHGKPTTLGYRWGAKGELVVDPPSAEVVKWIYDQYLSGMGMLRIAEALKEGVPGLRTDILLHEFRDIRPHSVRDRISWILQNPTYAGLVRINGQTYPGRHPAIISRDAWDKVQDLIRERQYLPNRLHTSKYILSGRIFCGECGAPMYGFRQPNRFKSKAGRPYYEYYCCRNGVTWQARLKTCENWGVSKEFVEQKVIASLRDLALNPSAAAPPEEMNESNSAYDRVASIQAAMADCQKRQKRLIVALEQAPECDQSLLQRLRELSDEYQRLTRDLELAEREASRQERAISREHALAILNSVPAILDNADLDQIREIVRLFVRRVIVTRTERMVRGNREKAVTVEFYPL